MRQRLAVRFWSLVSNGNGIILALAVFVGPIIVLHLDERIAALLAGGLFALNGIGQIVLARQESGGMRWLGFEIGLLVLLVGALMTIAAALMLAFDVPIRLAGG
jgi:hypothetical protein